jgi:hypothetical protein
MINANMQTSSISQPPARTRLTGHAVSMHAPMSGERQEQVPTYQACVKAIDAYFRPSKKGMKRL